MSKKFLTNSCGAVTLAFALSAMPAWAGFEWVTPPQGNAGYQQPSAPAPSYATPSYATTAPEVISPVIISGTPAPAPLAPIQIAPPAPQPSAIAARQVAPTYNPPAYTPPPYNPPPAAAPTGAPINLATATIAMPASSGGEVVQGFASQVPLTLALRQLLPSGYNFSIDQNVDMNMLVSYKGGKPWRDTLTDLLAPAGLGFHEQGNVLAIGYLSPAVPAPVAAAAPAPYPPARAGYMDTTISTASAPLPSVNVGMADGWSAQRGDTLRKVLTDWCARNGVELQWVAEYDYPMEASVHFSGDFESAVRDLLAGFDNARPQPYAELHTNTNAGQKILVVQARGNSYSN